MNSKTEVLSFEAFCDMLMPFGALNSPSELHGMFCGRLCGGMQLSQDKWLEAAFELLDLAQESSAELEHEVLNLFESLQAQLESDDFTFQLYLPDDDCDLEMRTQALSHWCQGFLTGYGCSVQDRNKELHNDHAEALKDIATIIQVEANVEETENSEEETHYMELIEYLRVLTMNFYLDHRSEKQEIPAIH